MNGLLRKWILWYAIIIHYIWGGILVATTRAMETAGLADILRVFNNQKVAGGVLLISSTLAIYGLTRKERGPLALACLIPQQALMILSAVSALTCIVVSRYADGVVRPRDFIVIDQSPAIVAALCHTVALVDYHFIGRKWR